MEKKGKEMEQQQKVSKKDFIKNVLASWHLFLFALAACLFFGILFIWTVAGVVQERKEIAQMAPYYEVTKGKVLSVDIKKYYSRSAKSVDIIPDKKYIAKISYKDKDGISHKIMSSEVDKKLKVGQMVNVAYHITDKNKGDIAYYDILVLKYVPCHLNTFHWSYIGFWVVLVVMAILFGGLFWGMLEECGQTVYEKPPKKVVTRKQLRISRNLYTLAGCFLLPLCIYWNYAYVSGKKMILLPSLEGLLVDMPIHLKLVCMTLVCYLPVVICFLLRNIYEYRRLKAPKV